MAAQGPRQRALMQSGKPNFRTLNKPTKTKAAGGKAGSKRKIEDPPPPRTTPCQVFSSSRPHSLYLDEACGTCTDSRPGSTPGWPGKMAVERVCEHTRLQEHVDTCVHMYKLGRPFEGKSLMKDAQKGSRKR